MPLRMPLSISATKAGKGSLRWRVKVYALARAVQRNARLLAVLESMDNGKSIRETRAHAKQMLERAQTA